MTRSSPKIAAARPSFHILTTSSLQEPKLKTYSQTSDPFGFYVQLCWHTFLHRQTHHAFTDISMQRHARAHITDHWRGTEITPWSIILWKLKGPPAWSSRLCTERKGFGLCGCVSALPENLPLMNTEVHLFLFTGFGDWLLLLCLLILSFLSPPHPFLSCIFKQNDLYHFLGRAQGKRWKLGSRSMNINKTFYTPSKGQARHFFLPSPSPFFFSFCSPFPHCLSTLLWHHSILSEWKGWVVLNIDLIGPLSP